MKQEWKSLLECLIPIFNIHSNTMHKYIILNNFKTIIKKIAPNFLIEFTKKPIILLSKFKKTEIYKIIKNPNLKELKIIYNEVWKNESIPKKQESKILHRKEVKNYKNVPPMKAMVDLLSKVETNNKNLLEIGCSSGYYSEIFKKAGLNIGYEGCDYSPAFIKLAKKKYPDINFKICDATTLEYNDNQFDIVVSGCCILHIIDYPKVIAETARVSRQYTLFHRTPVLHKNKTTFLTKTGYNTKMLEIFFNEEELTNLFLKNNLTIKIINTHAQFPVKGISEPVYMKSYLCEKK